MLHKESIEFIWESPEFEYKEKSKKWYWYIGIAVFLLIVLSIFLKNYLFSFLVLIAGFLIFSLATKKPEILSTEISKHGIRIHGDMHAYKDIFYFWITQNSEKESILLITTNKRIAPTISTTIPPRINVMQLREFLLQFIEEQEIREPLTDRIIEKIGF